MEPLQILSSVQSVTTSVKTIFDLIKNIKDLSKSNPELKAQDLNTDLEKVTNLVESLKDKTHDLQTEVLTLKSENLEKVVDFESKIREKDTENQKITRELEEYRSWEKQEKLFPVFMTESRTIVRKSSEQEGAYICPTCFEKKLRIFLQPQSGSQYYCNGCNQPYFFKQSRGNSFVY